MKEHLDNENLHKPKVNDNDTSTRKMVDFHVEHTILRMESTEGFLYQSHLVRRQVEKAALVSLAEAFPELSLCLFYVRLESF
jgi:hypothetical protein